MNPTVFLLFAGATSAWHVLDTRNNHDIDGGVVIDRRNREYISQNPERTPYVNSDLRQIDKAIRTKFFQEFVQPTWKYIEQNHEEPLYHIRNEENDYRLRTNAYTTKAYTTTEYIMQDGNTYSNKKEQNNIVERNRARHGVISEEGYQRGTQNGGFIKNDFPKSSTENRSSINYNQEKRPETNILLKYPHNESTLNITNNRKTSAGMVETVRIQPIPTEEMKQGIERLPKTNTDKQLWVWGKERSNVMTTEPDSLDNRAAFTGDRCSSGLAKVMGICVEVD